VVICGDDDPKWLACFCIGFGPSWWHGSKADRTVKTRDLKRPENLTCHRVCTSKVGNETLTSNMIWLVVSNMNFIFQNMWDNPSHWHIFFSDYYILVVLFLLINLVLEFGV
jgi:hypothetical protein